MEQPNTPDWVLNQANTYLNWINLKLRSANPPQEELSDILEVGNGISLLYVLQICEKQKPLFIWNTSPKTIYHRMENIDSLINFIRDNYSKRLGGISADFIVMNPTLKYILGLVWSLIYIYQISAINKLEKIVEEDFTEHDKQLNDSEEIPPSIDEYIKADEKVQSSMKEEEKRYIKEEKEEEKIFIDFINKILIKKNLNIINKFSEFLKDRKYFYNFVEYFLSDLSSKLKLQDFDDNKFFNTLFEICNKDLQIPKLLDAEFMLKSKDSNSLMIYLSFFRALDIKRKAERRTSLELKLKRQIEEQKIIKNREKTKQQEENEKREKERKREELEKESGELFQKFSKGFILDSKRKISSPIRPSSSIEKINVQTYNKSKTKAQGKFDTLFEELFSSSNESFSKIQNSTSNLDKNLYSETNNKSLIPSKSDFDSKNIKASQNIEKPFKNERTEKEESKSIEEKEIISKLTFEILKHKMKLDKTIKEFKETEESYIAQLDEFDSFFISNLKNVVNKKVLNESSFQSLKDIIKIGKSFISEMQKIFPTFGIPLVKETLECSENVNGNKEKSICKVTEIENLSEKEKRNILFLNSLIFTKEKSFGKVLNDFAFLFRCYLHYSTIHSEINNKIVKFREIEKERMPKKFLSSKSANFGDSQKSRNSSFSHSNNEFKGNGNFGLNNNNMDRESFESFGSLILHTENRLSKMFINNYLILPIQRIGRYVLLTREILKHSKNIQTIILSSLSSQNNNKLKNFEVLGNGSKEVFYKLSENIKEVLTLFEKAEKTLKENAEKIDAAVEKDLKEKEVLKLDSIIIGKEKFTKPGRFIYKQGFLKKISQNRDIQYYFVLFNDILIYGDFLKGKLKVHKSLSINASFSVRSLLDTLNEPQNRIEIKSTQKSFIVYPNHKFQNSKQFRAEKLRALKREWIKCFTMAIEAIRKQTGGFQGTSTAGIKVTASNKTKFKNSKCFICRRMNFKEGENLYECISCSQQVCQRCLVKVDKGENKTLLICSYCYKESTKSQVPGNLNSNYSYNAYNISNAYNTSNASNGYNSMNKGQVDNRSSFGIQRGNGNSMPRRSGSLDQLNLLRKNLENLKERERLVEKRMNEVNVGGANPPPPSSSYISKNNINGSNYNYNDSNRNSYNSGQRGSGNYYQYPQNVPNQQYPQSSQMGQYSQYQQNIENQQYPKTSQNPQFQHYMNYNQNYQQRNSQNRNSENYSNYQNFGYQQSGYQNMGQNYYDKYEGCYRDDKLYACPNCKAVFRKLDSTARFVYCSNCNIILNT